MWLVEFDATAGRLYLLLEDYLLLKMFPVTSVGKHPSYKLTWDSHAVKDTA